MTTLAPKLDNPILAIDEDSDDTDVLRIFLRKGGLLNPLEVFRRGEQAIAALGKLVQQSLKSMRPLVCFLEPQLPPKNGYEVLRWIRSQAELDQLAVVMLASSDHPKDIQQAAAAGAQCYLAKYPQPAILRHVVQDARRFAEGAPAEECFRIPSNLLLVRCRRLQAEQPPRSPVTVGTPGIR